MRIPACLLLMLLIALSGCGVKGDLYLPDERAATAARAGAAEAS